MNDSARRFGKAGTSSILRLLLAATLLALLSSGCAPGLVTQPADPPGVYLLESAADDLLPVANAKPGPTIMVGAVRSAAGFTSTDMIYVKEPHHLQAFARHRWADRPGRMLEPALVNVLEASGLFGHVAAPGSPVRGDLQLDTELRRLQQVFTETDSQVELELRISLVAVGPRRLLASQMFRIIVAAEPSPYGGVIAANRAVALLQPELVAFLQRATTTPSP
jgi:cholesterol transport system auxiliary component